MHSKCSVKPLHKISIWLQQAVLNTQSTETLKNMTIISDSNLDQTVNIIHLVNLRRMGDYLA